MHHGMPSPLRIHLWFLRSVKRFMCLWTQMLAKSGSTIACTEHRFVCQQASRSSDCHGEFGHGLYYLHVAGANSIWEQGKREARKMLENAAKSHLSGVRFVSHLLDLESFDYL